MNARINSADAELVQAAIGRLHEPVDKARAVFRGTTIVGHRSSIPTGEMHWALPGGEFGTTDAMRLADPSFKVIDEPLSSYLSEQQPLLAKLEGRQ